MNSTPKLSTAETVALLDEVAASIRAEVPLSTSLATLEGRDAGRIAVVAQRIRQDIENGVALDEAIAKHVHQYSGAISTALQIGLKTGNPARTLKTLANLILRRRELRLRRMAAAVYPLIVIFVGYLIGVFVFGRIISLESDFINWPGFVERLTELLQSFWWLPLLILPAAFLTFRLLRLARFLPRSLQPIRLSNQALFCEAVGWQIESGVSLPDAIRAAAEISGERSLLEDANRWADSIEKGQNDPGTLSSFRPLVVWTINQGAKNESNASLSSDESIVRALGQLSASYRSSEQNAWMFWTHWVPVATACIIGGSLAVSYLCIAVWPLYSKLAEVQ